MRFDFWNNELDILEEDDSEELVFNYFKSMAGHTISLGNDYELIETEVKGTYLIKRRKVENGEKTT